MSNQLQLSSKALFSQENVAAKFTEILGSKSKAFMTSVLQCVNSNNLLANADPHTVLHAAMVAATLDLPINNSLGFAYIVPFNNAKAGKQEAQFQLGWRGYVQLAQRSGQFKTISVTEVFEGQLVEENPLSGFIFDWKAKKSDTVIGYAAYFSLLNGFEKTLYMSKIDAEKHGKKFSQTYKRGFGVWKDDFDAMAKKTVLKMLISKFAPMSVEMQKAAVTDQAVIRNEEGTEVDYTDHQEIVIDEFAARVEGFINRAETVEDLEDLLQDVAPEQMDLFNQKMDALKISNKKK